MNWNYGDAAPDAVEARPHFGQKAYVFNFRIERVDGELGTYRWLTVETPPAVWDKSAVIRAIIRLRYSADDVEAVINNVLNDPSRVDEYKELQMWRSTAKREAAACMAWGEANGLHEPVDEQEEHLSSSVELTPDGMEVLLQAVSLLKKQADLLDDGQAAEVPALFPTWESRIGQQVAVGERLFYGGRLWKVLQAHTVQADWTPDVVPALFTEVVVQQEGEAEIGTLDNPIAYNGNMELEEGLYYTQYDAVYLCTRSTGTPVYHDLSALVGLYVERVNS